MRRRINSVGSHGLVAALTALITSIAFTNVCIMSWHAPSSIVSDERFQSTFLKQVNNERNPSAQWETYDVSAARIDFSSCPPDRVKIAPRVNYKLGMGNKMTEAFYFLWYAITRGHCFCFDVQNFGNDVELYHLLLEPLLPTCPANQKLLDTSVQDLETATSRNTTVIYRMIPSMAQVWNNAQRVRPPGFGDVLAFVDQFFRDNRLVEDVMYPWYQQHKTIGPVTLNETSTITVAAHLRVGDLVLESSESYWRTVLTNVLRVVDFEKGRRGVDIHIYFVYFQANHRSAAGQRERQKLNDNVGGDWPSKVEMLPDSHRFLQKLCHEFEHLECYWKWGVSLLESIDLFVESDVLYISGSSFSQTLSLFNPRAIKLIALPKELNWHGQAKTGTVPFLQTHTNAFTSLKYYYLDGMGELFPEHYAFLRLNASSDATQTIH